MDTPTWSDGFSRLVVAAAIYGDLIEALPGAFTPDLFGVSQSPRQRIARAISQFVEKKGRAPSPEEADQVISREYATLTEEEQEAVAQEWQYVQDTELPPDLNFVKEELRNWIEYQRLSSAVSDARDALARSNVDGLIEARETLAKVEAVQTAQNSVLEFIGGAEDRIKLWSEGIQMGERIPTRLKALDDALGGGPTRKETWYFLAPPKGMKTTFLLRVARGASELGFGVYVATYEMQALRMLLRADQMAAKKSKKEIAGDGETPGDLKSLRKAFEGMRVGGAGEIYVEQRPTQQKGAADEIARSVKRIRDRGGVVDAVVLDYLNIMGAAKNEREKRHELTRISREMSDMAKYLNVVTWSAALVNRQAVEKTIIRKTDIAEAFEVISVADGVVAICAPPFMLAKNLRRLWVAAAREEQDETIGGDYAVDISRMVIEPYNSQDVDRLIEENVKSRARRNRPAVDVDGA